MIVDMLNVRHHKKACEHPVVSHLGIKRNLYNIRNSNGTYALVVNYSCPYQRLSFSLLPSKSLVAKPPFVPTPMSIRRTQ